MKLDHKLYNIDSLHLLERLPSRSIDLVYFDPPWVQRDEDIDEYLLFLARRIQHVHRVLSETGNFFFHLPPHLIARVGILIEQVFGKGAFRNQFIVTFNSHRSVNTLRPQPNYSAVLLYGKSDQSIYNHPTRPWLVDEAEKIYPYSDDQGYYRLVSLFVRRDRPNLVYEWNGINPPEGRSWAYSRERLEELNQKGLISFNVSCKIPSLKQYANDTGVPVGSVWDDLSKLLTVNERTGYTSQQSTRLLERIVKIGCNEGGTVVDPFCGSGTTLVAAQTNSRQWIGCDTSLEALEIATSRLNEPADENLAVRTRFVDEVVADFPEVIKLKDLKPQVKLWSAETEEFEPERDFVKPLIITEGKTDWKHLKAAFVKLKAVGMLDEGFDIDFHEYEKLDMGDAELYKMCQAYSKTPQIRRYVYIFDRDKDDIVKKVSPDGHAYKHWGNNVFSLAIPLPSHRESEAKVSIEHYYRDADLSRKDKFGRRLFFSNEFYAKSGIHRTIKTIVCSDRNSLNEGIKIIDGQVYNSANDNPEENIALAKNDFADYILLRQKPFDKIKVDEFKRIFDIISDIMKVAA